jgi:N-acetyl-anhydromuramyl-L-alanine amidase AmpD
VIRLLLRLLGFGPAPEPEEDTLVDSPPPAQEEPDPAPLTVWPDGWLVGPGVKLIPTKRPGYRWRTGNGEPGGLLVHWTATAHGTGEAMVRRRVEGTGGSVHFWVEHDGTILQSVATTKGHGHAGGATSAKLAERDGRVVLDPKGTYSANYFLLGVEVVNVGEVRQVGGRWMGWPFGADGKNGPIVPADQVETCADRNGRVRHYQRFTDEQIVALERLIRALVDRYGYDAAAVSWGHCDVDPGRKTDPGPLWSTRELPRILARLGVE